MTTTTELISSIKDIKLNHADLMDVALNFVDIYFEMGNEKKENFDQYWDNVYFIDSALICVKEGVVLAMSALTLEKNANYKEIVEGVINRNLQNELIEKITNNFKEKLELTKFLNSLRTESFTRIYSGNKDFYKISKLSKDLVKDRLNIFLQIAQ